MRSGAANFGTGISGSVTNCGSTPSGAPPAPRTSVARRRVRAARTARRCTRVAVPARLAEHAPVLRARPRSSASNARRCLGCATDSSASAERRAQALRLARELVDDRRAAPRPPSASRRSRPPARRAPARAAPTARRPALREAGADLARSARAPRGPPPAACRRRRCGPRAAARGRSSGWRGCPGRGTLPPAFMPISLGVRAGHDHRRPGRIGRGDQAVQRELGQRTPPRPRPARPAAPRPAQPAITALIATFSTVASPS